MNVMHKCWIHIVNILSDYKILRRCSISNCHSCLCLYYSSVKFLSFIAFHSLVSYVVHRKRGRPVFQRYLFHSLVESISVQSLQKPTRTSFVYVLRMSTIIELLSIYYLLLVEFRDFLVCHLHSC